jgi:hypothetical protein
MYRHIHMSLSLNICLLYSVEMQLHVAFDTFILHTVTVLGCVKGKNKVKVYPITGHEGLEVQDRYVLLLFL